MSRSRIPSQLVACPECAQQPGEPCVDSDRAPLAYVHAARVDAAAFISGALDEGKSVAITDESILDTGLV
jgi:hypothetical protein